MGNHHCAPPTPIIIAPPQIRTTKQRDKDIVAVRSVSNPSLVSQIEDEEELIETSISQQFNESYMELVFQKYQKQVGNTRDFMPPDSVKTIVNVLDTICMDENIMYLAMKMSEAIVRHDDTWGGIFSQCAERNPLKYAEARGYLTDSRIIMHAMMVFRTLKVITAALEENNIQQVKNILDLMALSHVCMKVQPTYYRPFVVCMIKNLLHFNIITDELLSIFVNFCMRIITTIEEGTQMWFRRHAELLNQMSDGPTSPSREYYRELKKWRIYVLSCYKYLAKPLLALEKSMQSAHKLLLSTAGEDDQDEKWKVIRCLKKGYKYRSVTDNQNHL